jgi:2-dehydropantoate 2-reductase
MVPFQGFDLYRIEINSQKELAERLPLFSVLFEPHRLIRTGILTDIWKGQMPEIATYNGIICSWGKKWGVATPVNDQIVDIITGMAEGRYRVHVENVSRIKFPELPVK